MSYEQIRVQGKFDTIHVIYIAIGPSRNTIPSAPTIASIPCTGRMLFRVKKPIHIIFAVVIVYTRSCIRLGPSVPTLLKSRSLAIHMYRLAHYK